MSQLDRIAETGEDFKASYVYVLKGLEDGRRTRLPHMTACQQILHEARGSLPEDVEEQFSNYLAEQSKKLDSTRTWASSFASALRDGVPAPHRDSRRGFIDPSDTGSMSGIMLALWGAQMRGKQGVTVWEIKVMTGRMSHTISGGMSQLHLAGIVSCLTEKR